VGAMFSNIYTVPKPPSPFLSSLLASGYIPPEVDLAVGVAVVQDHVEKLRGRLQSRLLGHLHRIKNIISGTQLKKFQYNILCLKHSKKL
jgi:hypothetical protein